MRIHCKYLGRETYLKSVRLRILGIGVLLILTAEMLSIISPIPSSFADPPQPATQPLSLTKTYVANQFRTQVQTTITFRAELNGTVIFSRDNVEAFRIFVPNGLIGITTLLNNETHAIVDVRGGVFFIQEKWKLNAQNFKMELCWNLATPTTLKLPLSRVDSFAGNIFTISKLRFDWNDAVQAGYQISLDNSTRAVQVSVPASGCLDPTVTTVSTQELTYNQSEKVRFSNGRWYVMYCVASGGPIRIKSSADGTTWNAGNTVEKWTGESCDTNSSFYLDGNNIYAVWATCCGNTEGKHFRYRRMTYTSDGTITNATYAHVFTSAECPGSGVFLPSVTVNSTDFPFIAVYSNDCSNNDARLRLYMPSDVQGTSWTEYSFLIASSVGQNAAINTKILNIGSGMIRAVYNDAHSGGNLKTRIWYQGSRSFGSETTIHASLSKSWSDSFWQDYDCESTSNFVTHCLFHQSSKLRYRNITGTSNILSSTFNITATLAAGTINPTVSKESDNSTIFLATLHESSDIIIWNRSSTNLSWIESGTIAVSATATRFAVSSMFRSDNGEGGYITVTGSASPFSIEFQTLPVSLPWGTDIVVMDSSDHEREPHIVASTKSNTLVAVAIKAPAVGSGNCTTKASTNGGDSWSNTSTIPKELGNSRSGDPAIATNSTGGFIMVCGEWGNPGTPDDRKERIYAYSSANGITWTKHSDVAIDNNSTVFLDKPWIAVDSNQSSPYKDHVYVCWTQFHGNPAPDDITYTQLMFKRISPNPTPAKVLFNSTFTHGSQIGCNMAIGTNGELYVPWFNYQLGGPLNGTLQFRWNDRGGEDWGWGRIQNVTSFKRSLKYHPNCLPDNNWDCVKGTGTSAIRIGFMPGLAVDMRGGVHIVYAENVTTGGIMNTDIRYVNSDDCRKGSSVDRCSWNSPLTINLDASNRDQFMPTIHVSNITSPSAPRGSIYVTALDRRNDADNEDWEIWSYTCVPGATLGCRAVSDWSNAVISDTPINNQGLNFVGDYNGIAHTKTREAYPVWVDDRQYSEVQGNKLFDIYGDWSKR